MNAVGVKSKKTDRPSSALPTNSGRIPGSKDESHWGRLSYEAPRAPCSEKAGIRFRAPAVCWPCVVGSECKTSGGFMTLAASGCGQRQTVDGLLALPKGLLIYLS